MQASLCFPPVAAANARILILGSLPGTESLRRQQYYAKPQNRFWWIMGQLYGAHPDLPYDDRLSILQRSGIALWDVCRSAERQGSLDSAIRPDSVIPNDIAAFLDAHPHIELIACNGSGAAKLFTTMVLPTLSPRQAAIPRALLPSTSPAHAAMPPAVKLARWKDALAAAS